MLMFPSKHKGKTLQITKKTGTPASTWSMSDVPNYQQFTSDNVGASYISGTANSTLVAGRTYTQTVTFSASACRILYSPSGITAKFRPNSYFYA